MSRFLDHSIALNIIGLTVISAVEAWRPGFVSGAVNMSVVWLVVVVLICGGVIMRKEKIGEE